MTAIPSPVAFMLVLALLATLAAVLSSWYYKQKG